MRSFIKKENNRLYDCSCKERLKSNVRLISWVHSGTIHNIDIQCEKICTANFTYSTSTLERDVKYVQSWQ